MARHYHPKPTELLRASNKYLTSLDHKVSAEKALTLMSKVPSTTVRDIQYPKDGSYTCWYLSVKGYEKLPIVNFTLQRSGNLNVEFRYMEFVPLEVRDRLQWQTGNWPYARISDTGYNVEPVSKMLADYVPLCETALKEGRLKRGGTSAAELVLSDIFKISGLKVIEGERPEWLRNERGKLLQLDFYIPSTRIAIEVQGPHHFKDIHGKPDQLNRRKENDQSKAKVCLNNDISMIWMNSQGIQKELVRQHSSEQVKYMNELLKVVKRQHPCHMIWESISAGAGVARSSAPGF